MDWSAHLHPKNPKQKVQLKESMQEIRRLIERKEELDKMTLMKQRGELVKATIIYSFFKHPTQENRRVVAQLVEIFESLPTDLLPMETYNFFEWEQEQEMTKLILQKRMGGFMGLVSTLRFQNHFFFFFQSPFTSLVGDAMNCEIIKEQLIKVFHEIDKRKVERDAYQRRNFFETLKKADFGMKNYKAGDPTPSRIEVHLGKYVNIDQETIDEQLRCDEINRNWLQALIHERFIGIMQLFSFPMITDNPKKLAYINEIDAVMNGYDDVFQELRR